MASSDNRIVKLEFDNSDFEKNVAASLTTIGKLNESIAKIGSDGGLKTLSESAKGFNLDGMASAVDGLSAKFVGLATVGITAIQNITNRAVDAGITLAKSLTIDPITSGFAEYELKLGAIQTIMAGSGESLEVVNQKLAELNDYSDKTIYSFADMTQNIGKFTNAGVKLDDAVASIKGVANVAALSGANAEEASRAMYNFAQALSKGNVQLIDWKSIELANMGTVEFKQQLIDAAEAQGQLTKEGENWVTTAGNVVTATKGFNESLNDEWLTTEVLTKTLGDYADVTTDIGARATAAASDVKTFTQLLGTMRESAGSGWAETSEIVFGNFNEAKELFTNMNNIFGSLLSANADARNELLQGWKDLGGRQKLIQGFWATIGRGMEYLGPIKEAFREVFPKTTAIDLYLITDAFTRFMESLKPSEKTLENIKRVFVGLFSIFEIGWTVIKELTKLIVGFVKAIAGIGEGDKLAGLANIGDFFTDLNDKLVKGGGIADFFSKLAKSLKKVIPFLKDVKDAVVDFFESFDFDFDKISDFFKNFGDNVNGVSIDTSAFDPFVEKLGKVGDAVGEVWGSFKEFSDDLGNVWSNISGFFNDTGDAADATTDTITGAVEDADWEGIINSISVLLTGALVGGFLKMLKDGIDVDFSGGVFTALKEAIGEVTGTLKAMQTELKSEALLNIAIAIGALSVSLIALSFIDAEDLAKAMTAIAVGLGALIGSMKAIEQMDFTPKDALTMIGVATAIGIMAVAVGILAGATLLMSTMDWPELLKGLGAVLVLLGAMVVATKLLNVKDITSFAATGAGILLIATAIAVLAIPMKIFAGMDMDEIIKGLFTVIALLGSLVGAIKLLPSDTALRTAGVMPIALALVVLAGAMKIMNTMDWEEIVQGLIAVAGGLIALGLGVKRIPIDIGAKASGVLILSGALIVLAIAMGKFSDLGWGDILKSAFAIGITLQVLAVAVEELDDAVLSGFALILIVAALRGLAEVLKTFVDLGFWVIAGGLLAVAVSLAVIAGAAYLLSGAIPFMIGIGIGLAYIGLGLFLIGGGLALFGIGFAATVGAIIALASASDKVIENIPKILELIAMGIPILATGLAKGLIAFFVALADGTAEIVGAVVKIGYALLDGIEVLIPKIVEVLSKVISALVLLLVKHIPEWADAGYVVLMGILGGMRDNIGPITQVVADIIKNFLKELEIQLPLIITATTNVFIAFMNSVAYNLGRATSTLAVGVGLQFMAGFLAGLGLSWDDVKLWFSDFVDDIIDWVKTGFGIFSPSTVMKEIGNFVMEGFLNGVIETAKAVGIWFAALPSQILSWIGDVLTWLWQKGKDFIGGLIGGIGEKITEVQTFFEGIDDAIFGWIGDVSEFLKTKGKDFIGGIIKGVDEKVKEVKTWFEGLGSAIFGWIGSVYDTLKPKGISIISGFLGGIYEKATEVWAWVSGLKGEFLSKFGDGLTWLYQLGKDIIQGLWNGIEEVWKGFVKDVESKVQQLKNFWIGGLESHSPSRFMMRLGEDVMEGLAIGLETAYSMPAYQADRAVDGLKTTMINGVKDLNKITSGLEADLSPTIRPVMDLTQFSIDAKKLETLMPTNSTLQAGIIAGYDPGQVQPLDGTQAPATVTFSQTINAPKQLSTVDIYRQTRNQIAMAKEELSIP